MPELINNKKANFGTMPVFITAISTILGAVLFLRFGYAIGHTGLIGIFGIIILGHLITIPTALAVAEIATNQKVEGGGAYYIISPKISEWGNPGSNKDSCRDGCLRDEKGMYS